MSKRIEKFFLQTLILLLAFLTSPAIARSQNTQIEFEGFDTSALDAKIADAAAKANAPGASAEAKLDAANLYLERADLFYNAGRPSLYKLAVGDFRRVLRLQPDNAEARTKLDQIVDIYKTMSRPVPTNGDEADIYNDSNVRYKLKPESINFSAGKSFVAISGTLQPDIAYVYQIATDPGQHIDVSTTSEAGAALLSIYHGSLDEASIIVTGATQWNDIAFEPRRYLIKVSSNNGGTSYKLKVSVR